MDAVFYDGPSGQSYHDHNTIDPSFLEKPPSHAQNGPTDWQVSRVNQSSNLTSLISTVALTDHDYGRANAANFILNDEDADSDCSWTAEDEKDPLLFHIEQRLRSLILSESQIDFITQPLAKSQRRIVHAMCHLSHLGHSSIKSITGLSESRLHPIHIFKKNIGLPVPTRAITRPSNLPFPASWHGNTSPLETEMLARRLPRKESGFPCRFNDCEKTFHRACDRKKHERLHQRENYQYHCLHEGCDKAFRYPKDLRRHERVHAKRTSGWASDASNDEGLSDASMGSLSRSSSMVTAWKPATNVRAKRTASMVSVNESSFAPTLHTFFLDTSALTLDQSQTSTTTPPRRRTSGYGILNPPWEPNLETMDQYGRVDSTQHEYMGM